MDIPSGKVVKMIEKPRWELLGEEIDISKIKGSLPKVDITYQDV